MAEESESWKLWRQGLDDWREERLTEASIAFREAIAEARAALEKALELSLQRYKDESSAHVAIARCFLAEHFVRVLRFREAIEVTEPSVGAGASVEGLVLCVRARA